MLDGLLKSKFYTKCKANVKMTKTRVETIKKKKISVQKFLQSDIAHLLRNELDMNAYGRTEGLLIEQNMTRCYELVENFCVNLSTNLSLMQKQRECPEECREAVASLVYAAARFADLPELRDLRNIFEERFGNSLQIYINSEFMERLNLRSFTKEKRLQLLQDIANESSIEWDSKYLEQKLFTPPTIDDNQEKYVTQMRRSPHQQENKCGETDLNYRRRREEEENESTVSDFSQDGSNRKTSSSSAGSTSEDDADSSKTSFQVRIKPPPYLKPKPEKLAPTTEEDKNPKPKPEIFATTTEEDKNPKPRSVRQRNNNNKLKLPQQTPDKEEMVIDDLLEHYSNKKSNYDTATTKYVRGKKSELAMPPERVGSMPPEPASQAEKGPTRAASFHPNLPGDYEELAARIAALREKY